MHNRDSTAENPATLERTVKRFQAGSADALEALVGCFQATLAQFIGFMVRDPALVADLVQDTWLRVLEKRRSLRDAAKFRPWILRIAQRLVFAQLRRREATTNKVEDLPSIDPRPCEFMVSREERAAVLRAVDDLSSDRRAVMWLSVVEQLPHSDIARILDIPVGTARSRLHYALREIKTLLNRTGETS